MKKNTKIIFYPVLILIIIVILGYLIKENRKGDQITNLDSYKTVDYNQQNNSPVVKATTTETKNMNNPNEKYTEVTLETSMGQITFELATDKPKTTENFIKLSSSGFYNGVKFHRVIKGFMIQTGDPLSKNDSQKDYWGTGGPGYKFADELTGNEKYSMGTVAMANSGPDTNGSQFFIMTSDTPLPPNYTVFGQVIKGQDVAQKIQDVKTDSHDRPVEDVTIEKVDLQ